VTEQQIIWIKQLKKGNELAAYNLYKAYSKSMMNTLVRITGDTQLAEDLLQEGFVKAFKRIQELEDHRAFGGWLKRIMINVGIEYVRKKKQLFEDISDLQIEDDTDVAETIEPQIIHESIKSLPDGCRTVLSLHVFEGMKHAEIANQLKISESTSKTQYRHAKQLLKKKLEYHYAN
jgi:RNA polymerase sigma-70 factor (ECF subfamily)